MKDDLRKTSIKMAKPSGVKLVIKSMDDAVKAINSGVTDKYKLLTVVESIKDAERLCKECNIKKLNLGGTKATAETRNISKAMNITPAEETILKGLCEKYDILLQEINDRNTIRGGTTLGPMIGSHLPMAGCDLGIPMLAMHSARETMAMADYVSLCQLVTAFFAE